MARVLLIGGDTRAQALGKKLLLAGHCVRITASDPAAQAQLEAQGFEFHHGDPDRIATLIPALNASAVLCWLFGTASGTADEILALHTSRWAMMLERTADSPVRGVVYEAAGSVPADVLTLGIQTAKHAAKAWNIPIAVLETNPLKSQTLWLDDADRTINNLLKPNGDSS